MQLLTAKSLATILEVSPETAKDLMTSWGVPFIHLGVGRGKGFRWEMSAVVEALEKRRLAPVTENLPTPKPQKTKKAAPKTEHDLAVEFFSKPWREVKTLTKHHRSQ